MDDFFGRPFTRFPISTVDSSPVVGRMKGKVLCLQPKKKVKAEIENRSRIGWETVAARQSSGAGRHEDPDV